jgi:hypothetical protein
MDAVETCVPLILPSRSFCLPYGALAVDKRNLVAVNILPYIPQPEWHWSLKERWNHDFWGDEDCMGLKFEQGSNQVTPEIRAWFKGRGCCLEVSDGGWIYVAPLLYRVPPEFIFHITPADNVDSIRQRGLLTGAAAETSTSGRKDCSHAIYVSFDESRARAWADVKWLGKVRPGATWAMFRIASECLKQKVYRDPASQTGYILEDDHVEPQHLRMLYHFTATCEL